MSPGNKLIAEAGFLLAQIGAASVRFPGMPPPPKLIDEAAAWLVRAQDFLQLEEKNKPRSGSPE